MKVLPSSLGGGQRLCVSNIMSRQVQEGCISLSTRVVQALQEFELSPIKVSHEYRSDALLIVNVVY